MASYSIIVVINDFIVIDELNKNNYFKVTDSVKIIISKNNIISKEVIANKFK